MRPHVLVGPEARTAPHPPISMVNQYSVDAQKRHRQYRRNRAVAEIKDALSLLFMVATCISVVYLLGLI